MPYSPLLWISVFAFAITSLAQTAATTSASNAEAVAADWFEHLAPGVIRPDQGTVELDVVVLRPPSEFGNAYDFIFRMLPGEEISQRTLLGLVVPAAYHATPGLNFLARDERSTGVAHWNGFSPRKGERLRIAISWGGELRLHVNGQLVARAPHSAPLSPMPAVFEVRRDGPFRVESLRISSVQLSVQNLAERARSVLAREEHTTLLAGNGLKSGETYTTPWHREHLPAAVAPAWTESAQVFMAGEPISFPLAGLNHSNRSRVFHVTQTITSPGVDAELVRRHEWSLAPTPDGGPAEVLRLPLKGIGKPGYYRINTEILPVDGGAARAWESAISVLPTQDAPDGGMSMYLGHHYERDFPPTSRVMRRAGFRTLRVMENFLWFQVEPERGHFDWSEADRAVSDLESAGLDILGVLGNPPTWAAERPSPEIIAGHQNAAMPNRWKPRDLKEWENYVFTTVSRYRGRVKQWEIWNEVDFHPPAKPAAFSGDTGDYHRLLRAAFAQIRRADPQARVLTSGFSLTPGVCDTAMPYDLLKAGAADSFDIFNIHAYNGLQFLDQIDAALALHKPGAPRWMTEHMWHTIPNERNRMFLSAALPLWFMERGYDRFYTFGVHEISFDRINRSPRPDFHVLGVLQSHLRRADRFVGRVSFPGEENFNVRHGFVLADGRTLTVLGGQIASHRVSLGGDIESAVDLWGRPLPITRAADGVSLDILELAYLVSREPLRIRSTLALETLPLGHNGGFENVVGDIAMAGLSAGRPAEWSYRDRAFDPEGQIALATEARSGRYALELRSSGRGRVYAFQDTTIPKAGLYRLEAWVWCDPKSEGGAYLSLYDRGADKIYRREVRQKTGAGWERHSMDVRFDQPPLKQVAIIVGVAGDAPNRARFDDVSLVRLEDLAIAREVARPLELSSAATHALGDRLSAGPANPPVALAPLLRAGAGPAVIARVPFILPDNAARRSLIIVGPGEGLVLDSRAIAVGYPAARLALLHTAMFVRAKPDARLGEYRVVYADGTTVSIPLLNNHALRDWFTAAAPDGLAPVADVISDSGVEYGLFMTIWHNPFPQKPIRSLSLHADGNAALCLLAATADAPTPGLKISRSD